MMQNIYDNDTFFEGYKKIRNQPYNYNNLMEQPQLLSMLPALNEKRILDIGCGAGHFVHYCIEQHASNVIGIDVSANMINLAKQTYQHPHITFIHDALEHVELEAESFDIVCSSLVLHYIQDFDQAIAKISHALSTNGTLVFSINHPITTANLAEDDWLRDEQGKPKYLKLHRYHDESGRHIHWIVDDVIVYHRKLSTIINTLIKHGLAIEEIAESMPSADAIEKLPNLAKELERPCFLFVKAIKR